MALNYARGVIHWLAADGAGTDYVVDGLPFQPQAIAFKWNGLYATTDTENAALDMRRGCGFAVSASSRRAVATFADEGVTESNCGAIARNDCVACTVDGSGAGDGELDLESIESDGFTLTVDDQGVADITIMWEAWGGLDVAALVDIAEPSATGNQDYTVTGFDTAGNGDQVVMFAGCQSTAALNTGAGTDSGFCLGYATGPSNNVVLVGNADDASLTQDTDAYIQTGECVAMVVVGGGSTTARATLSQFNTNGFRLNWLARALTNRRYIALAMKGGRWQAGSTTIDMSTTNATATVSSLPFTMIGLDLLSKPGSAAAAAGTSVTNDHISWGAATSASDRIGFGYVDVNGGDLVEGGLAIEYDSVLLGFSLSTEAVNLRADINSFGSDSFQLIMDAGSVGASATTWIGYLAFGNVGGQTYTKDMPDALAVSDAVLRYRTVGRLASDTIAEVIDGAVKAALRLRRSDDALEVIDSYIKELIGGGAIIVKTSDDSFAVLDQNLRTVLRVRVSADALVITDQVTHSSRRYGLRDDPLAVSDGALRITIRGRVASDAVLPSDQYMARRLLNRRSDDALEIADQQYRMLALMRLMDETLAANDSFIKSVITPTEPQAFVPAITARIVRRIAA